MIVLSTALTLLVEQ